MSEITAKRQLPAQGRPSPRFGHLGVWNLSLGPSSPIPGERLQVLHRNRGRAVVRRFEQIEGRCIDPGYVDFFLSHKCRPAVDDGLSSISTRTGRLLRSCTRTTGRSWGWTSTCGC